MSTFVDDTYTIPNSPFTGDASTTDTCDDPTAGETVVNTGSAIESLWEGGASSGDIIYIRGGTYLWTDFAPGDGRLNSGSDVNVTWRSYPGEMAVLDWNGWSSATDQPALFFNSPGWEVRDLELTNRNDGPNPLTGRFDRKDHMNARTLSSFAENLRWINLVVHDAGGSFQGSASTSGGLFGHGLIFYNNGGLDRPVVAADGFVESGGGGQYGDGHDFYHQNDESIGPYLLQCSSSMNNFGYGIHSYGFSNEFRDMTYDSNSVAYASGPGGDTLVRDPGGGTSQYTPQGEFVLGGNPSLAMQDVTLESNGFRRLHNQTRPSVNVSQASGAAHSGLDLLNNRTVANNNNPGPANVGDWSGVTDTSAWLDDSAATGTHVRVCPNDYEPGRGKVEIFNDDNLATVDIPAAEVAKVLNVGECYAIWNNNRLGVDHVPVLTGDWQGGPITIPMNQATLEPAAVLGWDPQAGDDGASEARWDPSFGVFTIRRYDTWIAPYACHYSVTVPPNCGTVKVRPDGSYTYTPDPGCTADDFTLTAHEYDGTTTTSRQIFDIDSNMVDPVISNPSCDSEGQNSIGISWDTDVATATHVNYGTTPGGPYPNSYGPIGSNTAHSATIANLTPGTTYYFEIVAAPTTDESLSCATQPIPPVGGPKVDLTNLPKYLTCADPAAILASNVYGTVLASGQTIGVPGQSTPAPGGSVYTATSSGQVLSLAANASPGDIIRLDNGNYGQMTLVGGTHSDGLLFEPAPGASPVIGGPTQGLPFAANTPPAGVPYYGFEVNTGLYSALAFHGLTFDTIFNDGIGIQAPAGAVDDLWVSCNTFKNMGQAGVHHSAGARFRGYANVVDTTGLRAAQYNIANPGSQFTFGEGFYFGQGGQPVFAVRDIDIRFNEFMNGNYGEAIDVKVNSGSDRLLILNNYIHDWTVWSQAAITIWWDLTETTTLGPTTIVNNVIHGISSYQGTSTDGGAITFGEGPSASGVARNLIWDVDRYGISTAERTSGNGNDVDTLHNTVFGVNNGAAYVQNIDNGGSPMTFGGFDCNLSHDGSLGSFQASAGDFIGPVTGTAGGDPGSGFEPATFGALDGACADSSNLFTPPINCPQPATYTDPAQPGVTGNAGIGAPGAMAPIPDSDDDNTNNTGTAPVAVIVDCGVIPSSAFGTTDPGGGTSEPPPPLQSEQCDASWQITNDGAAFPNPITGNTKPTLTGYPTSALATIERVKWYTDGTLYRDDDLNAIFSLAPGPQGTAGEVTTETFPGGGAHTITAKVCFDDGSDCDVSTTITVAGDSSPTDPPDEPTTPVDKDLAIGSPPVISAPSGPGGTYVVNQPGTVVPSGTYDRIVVRALPATIEDVIVRHTGTSPQDGIRVDPGLSGTLTLRNVLVEHVPESTGAAAGHGIKFSGPSNPNNRISLIAENVHVKCFKDLIKVNQAFDLIDLTNSYLGPVCGNLNNYPNNSHNDALQTNGAAHPAGDPGKIRMRGVCLDGRDMNLQGITPNSGGNPSGGSFQGQQTVIARGQGIILTNSSNIDVCLEDIISQGWGTPFSLEQGGNGDMDLVNVESSGERNNMFYGQNGQGGVGVNFTTWTNIVDDGTTLASPPY